MLVALAVLGLCSACATSPDLGARSGYTGATVSRITVAPMYASSSLGAPETLLERRLELAELSAVEALGTFGYRVMGPDQLQASLDREHRWQDYLDGVLLRDDLEDHFEAEPRTGEPRLESTSITELADALPTRYVLFGQLVYHTTTTCRVDPVAYQPLAVVEPADATLPSPCAISHVAFKLVDARSGQTMWFNKVFLESRGDDGEELARHNLSRAVAEALVGARGLPHFFEPSAELAGSSS